MIKINKLIDFFQILFIPFQFYYNSESSLFNILNIVVLFSDFYSIGKRLKVSLLAENLQFLNQ